MPLPWNNEQEYMASWVWPSPGGGWYCRIDHQYYDTREAAEEAVRRKDAEAGIVWPWRRGAGHTAGKGVTPCPTSTAS